MHFDPCERKEYEQNILFEVVFQARFPEIMKISSEEPASFQDIVRKEGYPESGVSNSNLPQDIPEEFKKMISSDKEFLFFSEQKDWQVSLARNFVALSCKGDYLNYSDFRDRLEKVLRTFYKVYQPSYFTRIGLRYRNIANKSLFPIDGLTVREFIPEYIFPELKMKIVKDIKALEKFSQFEDDDIKANVLHALVNASGTFGQKQISNEESYLIDIDCFCENKIKEINDVLTKCDGFKKTEWDIFQWSVTKELRGAMVEKK